MGCLAYIRRHWKALLVRWLVFAALGSVAAYFVGWDLRAAWPAILIGATVANIMWSFLF